MKNRILALTSALIVLAISLCSCSLIFGDVDEQGDVTVAVENIDGTYDVFEVYLENVENKNEGANGILEYLNAKDDGLYLEMTDSTYGAYVSAIGSIKEDGASGAYVMVYTSVATDSYDGAPTVDYNGTTLYQSGVGLSGMNIESGTVILFRLETNPF
ncbi:MAG: hypothetical protein J6V80_00555 [Clostridia bacterium]|nr:hypothetical protein [Clostridia bacterium]